MYLFDFIMSGQACLFFIYVYFWHKRASIVLRTVSDCGTRSLQVVLNHAETPWTWNFSIVMQDELIFVHIRSRALIWYCGCAPAVQLPPSAWRPVGHTKHCVIALCCSDSLDLISQLVAHTGMPSPVCWCHQVNGNVSSSHSKSFSWLWQLLQLKAKES